MADLALIEAKESAKAYQAFVDYVDMGPKRSLRKLCDQYGRNRTYVTQLMRWSNEYDWQGRLKQLAAEQLEQATSLKTDSYLAIVGEYHRRVVVDEPMRKSMALNALHGIYDRVKPPDSTQSSDSPGVLVVRLEIVPSRQQD